MDIARNLDTVLKAIERAAHKVGRDPRAISLVAISKKQSTEWMQEYQNAAADRGVPVIFGENYLQELKAKRPLFSSPVQFHVTGPLQSNKVRDAVRLSDVIESVHNLAILNAIADEAGRQGTQQRVFLQVNIGADPNKSGFSADVVPPVIEHVQATLSTISLIGLMTITPYYDDPEQGRVDFARMKALRDSVIAAGKAEAFENAQVLLSMGMSADFEIAIEEGADLVRVGTALFGARA
jgi:pyridoxal phosphate enzyme (YggS family)